MCKITELYADGIGKINFMGGMIKMDLFSFEPTEDNKPEPKTNGRIVMSPQAFLAAYDSMVNMIGKLKAAGIIEARKSEENETAVVDEIENNVEVEAPTPTEEQ